jgi:hypothetical protein
LDTGFRRYGEKEAKFRVREKENPSVSPFAKGRVEIRVTGYRLSPVWERR